MAEQKDAKKSTQFYQGVVISKKMQKTVVALVETLYKHKKFEKTLRQVKKYKVHDEHGIAQVGDVVEFFSGRPVSKMKYMHLKRVVSAGSRDTVV